MEKIFLLANLFCTFYMIGVIWLIQIVHYPLFKKVGIDNFVEYEKIHSWKMGFVVGPIMIIELFTSFLLIDSFTKEVSKYYFIIGFVLMILIFLSTFLLQVPKHNILSKGFDGLAYRSLILTNWFRTIFWSFRGIILIFILNKII